MPGLSAWAVRRPVLALIAWFVTVAAIGVLGIGFGGNYNDSFDLPDTESKAATDLLIESGTDTSGLESGATIVWKPAEGPALSEETATTIVPMLQEMAEFESITCVTNPFDPASTGFGSDCPSGDQNEALFQLLTPEEIEILSSSFAPVSPDGTVAYASVSFVGDGTEGLPMEEAAAILELIEETNSDSLAVGAEGQVLDFAGGEPPSSEIIGVIFALVILLIAFGSVIAAGLPILTAIVGVGTGVLFVTFVANFLDVATFAPTLAAMIGLAVGIDYSLFILNRYRQGLLEGVDKQKAALVAVKTSGRAVVFAAFAVVVGLLGLLLIGINFFVGLSIGAAMTVVIVMLSAVWMLPALLGLLGTRALGWRLPWGRKPGSGPAPSKGWSTYARWLQKRPILPAIGAIGLIGLLAIPAFSLRQGFTDNSGRPEGSPSRIAYDLRAEGFGPGASGPYLVVVDLSETTDPNAYAQIVTTLNETPGVAGTNPSPETLPVIAKIAQAAPQEAANPIQVMAVYPTTAPQDAATSELLTTLREDVNPALEQATGATILVGGTAAITADFTTVLADALPIFLLVVVGLGFLALVVLFRSLLVPFIGAVTSMFSLAAAMGISVAVFQWGWFNSILGVPGTGPILPFIPIMVFAILFGLSMDYQVFLVSRMQEEWAKTKDNAESIRSGLRNSGRVVVIAALIMAVVFGAFVPSPDGIIKLFGVALASAVLIDAFVVRLVLVPSLMTMFGKANWWLPGWLERILPTVTIEPGDEEVGDQEESPEPVGAS